MIRIVLHYEPSELVDAERAQRAFRSLGIDVALEVIQREERKAVAPKRKPVLAASAANGDRFDW